MSLNNQIITVGLIGIKFGRDSESHELEPNLDNRVMDLFQN